MHSYSPLRILVQIVFLVAVEDVGLAAAVAATVGYEVFFDAAADSANDVAEAFAVLTDA